MDALYSALSARETRLKELEAETSVMRGEIAALRTALDIVTGGSRHTVNRVANLAVSQPSRGGKPPGSISSKWQGILTDLLPVATKHSLEDVHAVAEMREANLTVSAVRDRLRSLVETGYVVKHHDGMFSVTAEFASRYNLSAKPELVPLPREEQGANLQITEPPSA